MSRSNDPGHYFQTTEALATTERKAAKSKNKHGDPIKLSSKVLAVIADPWDENAVYLAEAVGEIKRVDLETRKVQKIFDQCAAPLTCLSICLQTKTLFTGCWDKFIYAIPLDNPTNIRKLAGHTDFLKTVLATTINKTPILISGSADSTIIIWDISTNKILHKLKGHTKAITNLAIDPLVSSSSSLPDEEDQGEGVEAEEEITLFSSSSSPILRTWTINLSTHTASETPTSLSQPLRPHETSIYRLHFDTSGDLWTCSADKTCHHLIRSRNWESDTTLPHPDFVRDIAVFDTLGLVVTACRDEEVRVWDASRGEVVCVYGGHFEEVTGLVACERQRKVVSVSIDGTLRQWSLDRKDMLAWEEERARETLTGVAAETEEEKAAGRGNMLTAEEEAELAELMDDDDDE